MAGILIEHARFVEVQQRRARVVAELMKPPQNLTSEAIELGGPDRHPIEVGPGKGRSMHDEAAAQPTDGAKRRRLTPWRPVDVG